MNLKTAAASTLLLSSALAFASIQQSGTAEHAPQKSGSSALVSQAGQQAMPVDQPLVIQFASPVAVASLNQQTVTLVGPKGKVPADITTTGAGLRISPQKQLDPDAAYSVYLNGVQAAAGKLLDPEVLSFHTDVLGRGNDETSSIERFTQVLSRWIGRPTVAEISGAPSAQFADWQMTRQTPELNDGYWYPAADNLDSHWRLNRKAPKPVRFDQTGLARPSGTAVYGQVLRMDDQPVAGVEVSVGDLKTRTDSNGYFLLAGMEQGRQQLYVDGSTADHWGDGYGQVVVPAEVLDGRMNELPRPVFLPRVRPQDKLQLTSPTREDIVVRHPEIPGLEVRIPAGTVFRDVHGRILTEIAIVPTPVDRAPYLVGVNFPVYFTLLPGGATVEGKLATTGLHVNYPNYSHAAPGKESTFVYFDPTRNLWINYGGARVSDDGKQVVADARTVFRMHVGFGHTITDGPRPPPRKCKPPQLNDLNTHQDHTRGARNQGGSGAAASTFGDGGMVSCGDPVFLHTGAFSFTRTDLSVQDISAISVARSYSSGDSDNKRAFGYGTGHDLGMYLIQKDDDLDGMTLVTSNGSVDFQRTSGSSYYGTWEQAGNTPSMYGAKMTSTLTEGGLGWEVQQSDGTAYVMHAHIPNAVEYIRDRYGNHINFTYDGGRLEKISIPSGRFIEFTYDNQDRVISASDHTGRTVTYHYDSSSNLDLVTYPDSTTESYTYDNFHKMLTMQDRRGNTVFTNTYDVLSRVDTQTLANGGVFQFAYTEDGHQKVVEASVTDPLGKVRHVVFHASGYPQFDTDAYGTPLARTYEFERDAAGQMTARIDPLGRRTEYDRDEVGDITEIRELAGTADEVATQYTYTNDGWHQLASVTDPLGHTTSFSYTTGCLTKVEDALGHATRITCNSVGQPVQITDALNHSTQIGYDGYDVYTVTDPLSRTVTYYRDDRGRVVGVMDPQGHIQQTGFDVMGRVNRTTDANGFVHQYGYDNNGNLTSFLDPTGHGVTWEYDTSNRLITRTDALSKAESWTYDEGDKVLTYVDRMSQTTTYSYDDAGRLEQLEDGGSRTVDYVYDAADRIVSVTDSDTGAIEWTWDALDRLEQEDSPQGVVNYTYDDAGRRQTLQIGSGTVTNYDYDIANRLTEITRGAETVEFAYDNANRRTQLTLPNGIEAAYGYDSASQLTSLAYSKSSSPIGDYSYSYNSVGQRTNTTGSFASDALPTATASDYSYNNANQLTGGNGITPTYDDNGSMLTDDQGRTLAWNARRQLVEIVDGISIVANFEYDALGRRIKKTIGAEPQVEYLHDGANPIQEVQGLDARTILTGAGIDERFARDDVGGRTYFLTDALGSTAALTDDDGDVTQQYAYDPYGNVTLSNPLSVLNNPYQYTGRENDGTGLNYYRARYYSPGMSRFVSEDPIGLAGGGEYVCLCCWQSH